MIGESPVRPWATALLAVSLVIFGMALVEFIIAAGVPSHGANIGAGIGMMGIMASVVAGICGVIVGSARSRGARIAAGTVATLALLWASFAVVLVIMGISEEFARVTGSG
jgi:hypothetical protein